MTLSPHLQRIGSFGSSGSKRYSEREFITYWNSWRAEILAGLVAKNEVVLVRSWRDRRGKLQRHVYRNPIFVHTITHGYTYPADIRATLQAFQDLLDSDADLARVAEMDGITDEALSWEIERTFEEPDNRRDPLGMCGKPAWMSCWEQEASRDLAWEGFDA